MFCQHVNVLSVEHCFFYGGLSWKHPSVQIGKHPLQIGTTYYLVGNRYLIGWVIVMYTMISSIILGEWEGSLSSRRANPTSGTELANNQVLTVCRQLGIGTKLSVLKKGIKTCWCVRTRLQGTHHSIIIIYYVYVPRSNYTCIN